MFSLNNNLDKAKNLTKKITEAHQKVFELENTYHKLLDSLTTGNRSSLETLFAIIAEQHSYKNLPFLAEQIAKNYDVKTISELAEQYDQENTDKYFRDIHKLLALITQELILCDKDPRTTVLEKIYHKYTGGGNNLRLNLLPLYLLAIEKEKLIHNTAISEQKTSKKIPYQKKILTTEAIMLMQSAVLHWDSQSNGVIETDLFELDKPINPEAVPALLGNFELEAIPENAAYKACQIPVNEAYAYLFWAAAQGGAYSRGYYGAIGRLSAWESLAGLVGANDPQDIGDVYKTAQKCEWFFFEGTTWFNDIAWDLGIVCLREDKKTIAVLAATDVD